MWAELEQVVFERQSMGFGVVIVGSLVEATPTSLTPSWAGSFKEVGK